MKLRGRLYFYDFTIGNLENQNDLMQFTWKIPAYDPALAVAIFRSVIDKTERPLNGFWKREKAYLLHRSNCDWVRKKIRRAEVYSLTYAPQLGNYYRHFILCDRLSTDQIISYCSSILLI